MNMSAEAIAKANVAQRKAESEINTMRTDLDSALPTRWIDLAHGNQDAGEMDEAFDVLIAGCAYEGVRPKNDTLEIMRKWVDAETGGKDAERWRGFLNTIEALPIS